MSMGKKFLSALLEDGSVSAFLDYGNMDHMFFGTEVPIFEFVKTFVKEYHKLPSSNTITLHTGEDLVDHEEPMAYYHDLMSLRYIERRLVKALQDTNEFLKPEHKDIMGGMAEFTKVAMELARETDKKKVIDFRYSHDAVIAAYAANYMPQPGANLKFGWPTIDIASGGFRRGDVFSLVGRPGLGKTWLMLQAALHGWQTPVIMDDDDPTAVKKEIWQSRLFVSMEMDLLPIQQRLASIQAHKDAYQVKHGQLSSKNFKMLTNSLMEVQTYGAPFWVVDGNLTATVEEIYNLAQQLNPDGIFIDGAYLMKHPTVKDRYQRVAENADLVKQNLAAICPTVCSWQFSKPKGKTGAKKKKGEVQTLDDIAYTDAIAQNSTVVAGMSEDESVETIKRRRVDILKGRNGETGSFYANWNFKSMDFSEWVEQDISELQFL